MKQRGWLSLIMVAGCSAQLDTAQVEQQAGGETCPPWNCTNSPEVLHYGLHEANLFGEWDTNNISLEVGGPNKRVQIWSAAGIPYDLYVDKNRFVGIAHDGQSKIDGKNLLFAELHVLKNGHPLYNITIQRVREIPFPVGNPDLLEVYMLTWHEPGTGLSASKQACNGPYGPKFKHYEELLGMLQDETLIFAGDRIKTERMEINEKPEPDWFNFGCAGHTLAKLHLTRNTITSQRSLHWEARQATLKMLVADYCGNGNPITMPGTPLRWQGDLVSYFPTPREIEARWNEKGATCLSMPRLGLSSEHFPDVLAAIDSKCTRPQPCTNTDLQDFDGELRVSAIPQ